MISYESILLFLYLLFVEMIFVFQDVNKMKRHSGPNDNQ